MKKALHGTNTVAHLTLKAVATGPLTAEEIEMVVAPSIPPERAVRRYMRDGSHSDHDNMVRRGRHTIVRESIANLSGRQDNRPISIQANGDGRYAATALAIDKNPEIFIVAVRSPLLKHLGMQLAQSLERHGPHSNYSMGLREALRAILTLDQEETSGAS